MSARGLCLSLRALLLTLATVLTLGGVLTARSAPTSFVTANNIVLQQGQTLPVFRINAPSVTGDTTRILARRLSGIGDQLTRQDEYLDRIRFTVPNTETKSLLTRYSASGGFYAFNLDDLGRDTPRGPVDRGAAELLACRFLFQNGFYGSSGQPVARDAGAAGGRYSRSAGMPVHAGSE